ncbi:MAG: Flp pilus assembly complex ATPase component TadA [Kiritimatiellae bacterium]|nr:Flp pilus assembly complex ATPase component TadA [Kiritimatiellia bacterium]
MMYTLTVVLGNEPARQLSLPDGLYTLGRGENCKIRLRDPGVSERHALLTLRDGSAWIEDLHSSNGTQVNGVDVTGPTRLRADTVVSAGGCLLRVAAAGSSEPASAPSPVPPAAEGSATRRDAETPKEHAPQATFRVLHEAAPVVDPQEAVMRQVKNQIHAELVQRLDLKRMTASGASAAELQTKVRDTLRGIIDEVRKNRRLTADIDPRRLEKEIYDEAMKLGPLEDLLADDSVTEIMVNGPDKIYVERKGKLQLTGKTFMDDDSVLAVIERIVAPIGRRIDESQPYVDARLSDGSRVNAIISPLSLSGPCITIRKFSKRALTAQDMIDYGTWTAGAAHFLQICVLLRKNIVVAGGTGSGKTTLLNVLSGFIPDGDRIVTIEDAAELRLEQPHVVRLEARPPNIEGKGAVTIRDLVRNSLRMRPDRIIVGECRGGETLDMLQAMNTGHDGSLTTVHANTPRDVISRLETMVLMSGVELPSRAIREQIASAIGMIVHESRLSDGSRKVMCISEIVGLEGQQVVMQDLFEFQQSGIGENGKIQGRFMPTGAMPTFYEELSHRGLTLDPQIFDPNSEVYRQ